MKNKNNKPAIKIIPPVIHGILDYVVVIFLLIAPSVFAGMGATLTVVVYALAVAHLALTLFTRFSAGLFPVLPLKIHALIELVVALGLVVSPWILAFAENAFARNFVIMFGAIIFVVWLLSDFGLVYESENSDGNEKEKDFEQSHNPPTTHA